MVLILVSLDGSQFSRDIQGEYTVCYLRTVENKLTWTYLTFQYVIEI